MDYTNSQSWTPFEGSTVTCERVALAIAISAKLMGAEDEAHALPVESEASLVALLAACVCEVAEA